MTTTVPPPGLALVRDFVNTADRDRGLDSLTSSEELAGWLAEHDLLPSGEPLTGAELAQAIAVREALRSLLLANNGGERDARAVDTLNAAAKSAELVVRFGAETADDLAPVRGGFDGALARLLAAVFRSIADGTWERLKACPRESCKWAFYDRSRNRSATWCDMRTCGNREKARAYRERHAGHRHD